MKNLLFATGLAVGLLCQLLSPLASDASSLRETPLVKAVKRAQTAVVNIHTEKSSDESNSIFGTTNRGKINGMGTGIVLDERGYVVTNNHVIAGVDSLEVSLCDSSRYSAHVVAFDRAHDLAIIKIDGNPKLDVMTIGTSSDLMVGETVIAVGNAFGYVHTVTSGIISSLSRDVEVNEEQQYRNLIQTDASINPGNSGGPLLNLDGEVIGINVAIRAGAQRIGFAIPIDDAREQIARLLSVETLEQKYHGLLTRDVKTPDSLQLIVDNVKSGSPSESAGFQNGDVIVRIGQTQIEDRVDLERSLLGLRTSDNIPVLIRRGSEEQELMLSLSRLSARQFASGVETPAKPSAQPVAFKGSGAWDVLGMQLEEMTGSSKKRLSPRYRGGMQVVNVRPGSPAAANGIRQGDVLVGLHVWETVNTENIDYVLDHPQLKTFNPLKFFILRNGETLYGHLNLSSTQATASR